MCSACSVQRAVYDVQFGCMAGTCTRVGLWQWRQTLKQPFSHSSSPIDKEDDDDDIHDEDKDNGVWEFHMLLDADPTDISKPPPKPRFSKQNILPAMNTGV